MPKRMNALPGGADVGLYNTPARVTDALLRRASFQGRALEPCFGTGAMARRLALGRASVKGPPAAQST